ncbi:hypothetical protein GCM10011316_04550 [Roseibium aquae]|uniref:Uncharacterized protein n=1 Tax=Roseibium aquae TaxID=1323746 RepID=A0A916TAR3_9HYPH|nr:hypothetical protein [Roseibium aquae]GGB35508.1 hypothetical protein GCM10011316_04550 [Roseibium aquae]
MVFNTIILLLFAVSIPLWAGRFLALSTLDPRAREIFQRLVRTKESPVAFAARMFVLLVALSGTLLILVYGMSYLQTGRLLHASYGEVMSNRLYSGVEGVDNTLDTAFYGLPLPITVLMKCLFLTAAFTLALKATNDLSIILRLRGKIKRLVRPSTGPAGGKSRSA